MFESLQIKKNNNSGEENEFVKSSSTGTEESNPENLSNCGSPSGSHSDSIEILPRKETPQTDTQEPLSLASSYTPEKEIPKTKPQGLTSLFDSPTPRSGDSSESRSEEQVAHLDAMSPAEDRSNSQESSSICDAGSQSDNLAGLFD